MSDHTIDFPGFILLLSAVVIFIIVFLVIKDILIKHSTFQGITSVIMATFVSLLGIIGLYRFFVVSNRISQPSENSSRNTDIDFILLPYVVLIISILFCLFLKYICKTFQPYREKRLSKELKSKAKDRKDASLKDSQDLSKSILTKDRQFSQIIQKKK